MDGQLPVPEWTPLILPDEILCEELSPTSPTPTDDGGGGAGPGMIFSLETVTKKLQLPKNMLVKKVYNF